MRWDDPRGGARHFTPSWRTCAALFVIVASGCGSQSTPTSQASDSGGIPDGVSAAEGASAADASRPDASVTDAQVHADTGGVDSSGTDATTTSPDGGPLTDAGSSDSPSATDGNAPSDGSPTDTGTPPVDAEEGCASLGGDCSGTATCCAPYVCSGPTYDCVPDGGHCPWSGGFVCETAHQGSCAVAGSSCERTSCCAPYVCDPNAGWTCTAPATCTTYGENCVETPCCDPFTCDNGTNACDFDYCDYSGSSCTYQTICCNGPCITSGSASFGVCP